MVENPFHKFPKLEATSTRVFFYETAQKPKVFNVLSQKTKDTRKISTFGKLGPQSYG